MAVFSFPSSDDNYRYYVYAMFCQDKARQGYVKFGKTRRVNVRFSQLRTGCPIPVKMFAVIEIMDESRMSRVEKALHDHFKDRRVRGEWFEFDFECLESKRAFNEGCRLVFDRELRLNDDKQWTKISVEALDKYQQEKADAFIALPAWIRKSIQAQARNKVVTWR
jgi:hypothetical protein